MRATAAVPLALLTACLTAAPREILFQAQRPGGTEDIYALQVRDGGIRRLVRADTFSSRSLPAWSPDGRALAFTREFGDTAQLYVLDSLGAIPRRLATDLAGFIAFPDWSPDGTRLLFSAGSHERYAIYLIHADGSGLRAVLEDSTTYRSPSWSPDGREFAVATYRNGRSEILLVDLATGTRRTVLRPDSAYADFPPMVAPGRRAAAHRLSGHSRPVRSGTSEVRGESGAPRPPDATLSRRDRRPRREQLRALVA